MGHDESSDRDGYFPFEGCNAVDGQNVRSLSATEIALRTGKKCRRNDELSGKLRNEFTDECRAGPQFGDWWLRYTRALKQRNAALRTQPDQASVWDPELARLGELIAEARRRFVDALVPHWREAVLALTDLEPELHYFKGWAQDVTLADALAASKARDETKRVTHLGPHRSDIVLRMNGKPAREVLSRGQQKLVAVAMTLAQLNLLQTTTQTRPTLLLDDPAAELDGKHLGRFIDQVMRLRSQLVLTSLHPASHLFGTPDRLFHVEQGRVNEA